MGARISSVWAISAFSATAIAACGNGQPEAESVGTVTNAVHGGQDYVDCSAHDRVVLRHAGILQRTLVGPAGLRRGVFYECLRDQIESNYVPCDGDNPDPFAASSLADQISSAITTTQFPNEQQITCNPELVGGGRTDPSNVGPWGRIVEDPSTPSGFRSLNEPIDISASLLSGAYLMLRPPLTTSSPSIAAIGQVASIMLHESFHTHGYRHNESNLGVCPSQGSKDLGNSMPYLVQLCLVQARVRGRSSYCNVECLAGGHIAVASEDTADAECECVPDTWVLHDDERDDPAADSELINQDTDAMGQALAKGDFDGDGWSDLAVGVPGDDSETGEVAVYYGTYWGLYRLRTLRPTEVSGGSRFGAAVAAADFNDDGYDDLAIGAPGHDAGRGRVFVFNGGPSRLDAAQQLSAASPAANDGFGQVLAAAFQGTAANASATRVLLVGAPGRRVGGVSAGAFSVYRRGYMGGALETQLTRVVEVFPPSNDALDAAEFGAALAAGRSGIDATESTVVVGAPGVNGAGKAYVFSTANLLAGSTAPAAALSPDTGAAGARFGAAVAFGPYVGTSTLTGKAFVGAPGAAKVYRFAASGGAAEEELQREVGSQFGATLVGPLALGGEAELPAAWRTPSGQLIGSLKRDLAGALFVGAPGDGGESGGYVAWYTGASGTSELQQTLTQALMSDSELGERLGAAIALGDFNNDNSVDLAVGSPASFAGRGFGGSSTSGSVFTFQRLETSCEGFLGWQLHSQDMEFGDVVPLVPPQYSILGELRAGDRVASDCQIYEATVDDPSGYPGSNDDWTVLSLSQLLDAWTTGEAYEVGDRILFEGVEYEARQAHTAQSDWQPPDVPALWQRPLPSGVAAWTVNTAYAVGSKVTYNGQQYLCIQAHTSLPGWDPAAVPALWQLAS